MTVGQNQAEVYGRLEKIFRKAFPGGPAWRPSLTPWDVPGWDSLKNMELVLETEREFGVRFTPVEAIAMMSGGQLAESVLSKLGAGSTR